MGRLATLLFAAACACAQTPEQSQLLSQVREKMLDTLVNQPNYTCLETIERTRQTPGGQNRVEDTLRLEVALVDGKEMFAWPGGTEFEDKELRDVVPTGMFGNGNYGLYVRAIFGGGGPRFEYRGTSLVSGRTLMRWDYRMKAPESGYYVRVDDRKALVGYHGSIYVDPATADLVRLEVIAEDIPEDLRLDAAEDRIDYRRMIIGEEEFLLPSESTLLMASKDAVSRNRTRFSACRKFTGESSLIFDDLELVAPVEDLGVAEVALPKDALLTLEIRSDLAPNQAAVGDPVEAVLRGDIKRGKEKVVPKGAIAKGRITALERTSSHTAFVIHFYDLEWKGGHAAVRASFERRGGIGLARDPRVVPLVPGAIVLRPPVPRNFRGEILYYRTER